MKTPPKTWEEQCAEVRRARDEFAKALKKEALETWAKIKAAFKTETKEAQS